MKKIKSGLYKAAELSNSEYHKIREGEEVFYSSSQFKTAKEDIELFYKKYILKEVVQESNAAFDIGQYYHTAILEPELLDSECTVYPGKTRRGKEWEAFKEANKDKVILTQGDYLKAENLITATKESPIAMGLLSEGESELSLFTEFMGVNVKVRADWINFEEGYILDLKSTTGNCKDVFKTQGKISNYDYDLSAAFYLDVFNSYLGKKGLPLIETFYWTFASKDIANSRTYRATDRMIEVGRAKYRKGLALIKEYQANGWTFYDILEDLSPLPWEEQVWLEGADEKKKFSNNKTKVRQVQDEDLL